MKIKTISPRTNFIKSKTIRTYHSAFFHGLTGRDGKWYPHDNALVDSLTPNPSTPTLKINCFFESEFTWSGSWPMVSSRVRELLNGLPYVRLQEAQIDKVICEPWSVNTPIHASRGNLTEAALFDEFIAVDTSKAIPRFEFQSIPLHKFSNILPCKTRLVLLLGTDPGYDQYELMVSEQLFEELPVFWFNGSLVVREDVFSRFEDTIHPQFFNVRTDSF